jgi:DNA repair ATPase RecN
MKEEIKNIILEYCEGISHLEFDADKLDEISERIEKLSKLHQPTVISAVCEHEYVRSVPHDKYKCLVCIKCMSVSQTDL